MVKRFSCIWLEFSLQQSLPYVQLVALLPFIPVTRASSVALVLTNVGLSRLRCLFYIPPQNIDTLTKSSYFTNFGYSFCDSKNLILQL